jgi:hypothetical protein
MSFQKIVKAWDNGAITSQHAIGDLLCELTEENYDELCQVPERLLKHLAKRVDEAPETGSEDWSLMRVFYAGSWIGNVDEIRKAKEDQDRLYLANFRRGVEAFRKLRGENGRTPNYEMYESIGILNYSGINRLVLQIDQELADFYRSMIPKYLPTNRPRWAAHVTVVREHKEEVVKREAWGKYEGHQVPFFYSPIIECDNTYYWLNVFCVRLEEIRIELGLSAVSRYTLPPSGFRKVFHTTIANSKEQ